MKKILFILALAAVTLGVTSCGGKGGNSQIAEENVSQLTAALQAKDINAATQIADSLANMVDDLEPDETVTVLLAYLEIHNQAAASGKADLDLETMRKYVDVYDIAVSSNSAGMKEAFADARRANPRADFEKAFQDFRRSLSEYDALNDMSEETETPAAAAPAKTEKTEEAAAAAEPAKAEAPAEKPSTAEAIATD